MLIIRFQRVGRKNDPAFRVVVTERRSKPQGTGLEMLGSYHPKNKVVSLNNERILYWLSKGAQASPTVHNLLISKGVIQGVKINVIRPPKKTEEAPAVKASADSMASAAEKPGEESVKEKMTEKESASPDSTSAVEEAQVKGAGDTVNQAKTEEKKEAAVS
jgi:small subunit ribosomal protein S16